MNTFCYLNSFTIVKKLDFVQKYHMVIRQDRIKQYMHVNQRKRRHNKPVYVSF